MAYNDSYQFRLSGLLIRSTFAAQNLVARPI